MFQSFTIGTKQQIPVLLKYNFFGAGADFEIFLEPESENHDRTGKYQLLGQEKIPVLTFLHN